MNETYQLIKNAKNGDRFSEEELVNNNVALVHSCVRRLIRDGFEYEDLLQIGCLALVKAIRRFDESYGVCFSTYAVPIITGDIKRYIRDNSTLKVSRSLKEIFFKISGLSAQFCTENSREPTLCELAEKSGYSMEKIIMALEACTPCDSLERKVSGDDLNTLNLGDVLTAGDKSMEVIERIDLKMAMNKLNEREKKIILLRYFRGKTQTEVSTIMGVSQVQISRIEKKIISSLKSYFA